MKKLLIVFLLGLFAFTNVYAEEVTANTSDGTYVEEYIESDVEAIKGQEGFTVTDDALLDIALDSLPEDTIMFDEDELETYRDVEMELETDGVITEDAKGSILTTLIIVLVVAAALIGGIVVLIEMVIYKKYTENKKKKHGDNSNFDPFKD